jgi:hypothetical protein
LRIKLLPLLAKLELLNAQCTVDDKPFSSAAASQLEAQQLASETLAPETKTALEPEPELAVYSMSDGLRLSAAEEGVPPKPVAADGLPWSQFFVMQKRLEEFQLRCVRAGLAIPMHWWLDSALSDAFCYVCMSEGRYILYWMRSLAF